VTERQTQSGTDLTQGVPAESLPDGGMLTGHVADEMVLLARLGDEFLAVRATCTHYNGPLAEGILDGETIRCPWHHACFNLRTGAAIRPPALIDLPRWRVEVLDGQVFVREKLAPRVFSPARRAGDPRSVLILGAGAAGNSAAETLRHEGFEGRITLVDPDVDAPYDRPNLSKDFLAGTIPDEWLPLHTGSYYAARGIELLRGHRAERIEVGAKRVILADGKTLSFDKLLIATGAAPVQLELPAADGRQIHYLRTLSDCRRIIGAATSASRAVVLGTSFIGLEVAAALRSRGLDVHVAGPDTLPLGRILGDELGEFIRDLHQEHGVVFHLEHTAREWSARGVMLDDGTCLPADLVVAGVGVRPNLQLAAQAGLTTDQGIVVDDRLETSAPGVFAAGDVARWTEPRSGDRVRIEHWAVAQRMGQAAARNMLGAHESFEAVPFFWSQHYDVPISYVGYAGRWDQVTVEGDLAARDCAVSYFRKGRVLAKATIYRDHESLTTELSMERDLVPASAAERR
jgi:NADPH-dependent 2,4-dienoyl-CoA reductase/sulfur reductase-like enzyme/nitrite reductase/ring-hydroxylating ferredoxin subunit